MPTPPKKAALYVRVSTSEQKTDLQLRDLREYAERRGFTVCEVYQETGSGAGGKRKELERLLTDAKKRQFDVVLVWKFDRFARSLKMLVECLELFQELGIDFISHQENIDTTTSMGKLIFHINSAYAEFEREIIRERVKAGIRAKREKTGTWGRGPLDPATQGNIKELAEQKVSVRVIARRLRISTRTVQKYKRFTSNTITNGP